MLCGTDGNPQNIPIYYRLNVINIQEKFVNMSVSHSAVTDMNNVMMSVILRKVTQVRIVHIRQVSHDEGEWPHTY